mmetsp:Transcript_79221/g.232619  ORF Transcript_79221/g.232619 Transcript_79221/m.232619 type:complete len:333 (+) Transcript_79221:1532-2530(+)
MCHLAELDGPLRLGVLVQEAHEARQRCQVCSALPGCSGGRGRLGGCACWRWSLGSGAATSGGNRPKDKGIRVPDGDALVLQLLQDHHGVFDANALEGRRHTVVVDVLLQAAVVVEPLDALDDLCLVIRRLLQRRSKGCELGLQLELDVSRGILHAGALVLHLLQELHRMLIANASKVLANLGELYWCSQATSLVELRHKLRNGRVFIHDGHMHLILACQPCSPLDVLCRVLHLVRLHLQLPQQHHSMRNLEPIQDVGNFCIVDWPKQAAKEVQPGNTLCHFLVIVNDIWLRPDPAGARDHVCDEASRVSHCCSTLLESPEHSHCLPSPDAVE